MPLTEEARWQGIRSNMEKRAYNDDRVRPGSRWQVLCAVSELWVSSHQQLVTGRSCR